MAGLKLTISPRGYREGHHYVSCSPPLKWSSNGQTIGLVDFPTVVRWMDVERHKARSSASPVPQCLAAVLRSLNIVSMLLTARAVRRFYNSPSARFCSLE